MLTGVANTAARYGAFTRALLDKLEEIDSPEWGNRDLPDYEALILSLREKLKLLSFEPAPVGRRRSSEPATLVYGTTSLVPLFIPWVLIEAAYLGSA